MVMIWMLNLHWNWQNYILLIVICYFVTETLNSWNPNLVVDNGWVNVYDVNDNDRNDVLTIIEMIWRWKNIELMILVIERKCWSSENEIAEMVMIWILNLLWNWPNYVLLIVIFYFVTENMNLWNRNLVVDKGWVNGYDVNDNDRNDLLTINDMIWCWKNNEIIILMWPLLKEMLNLWKWNSWNGGDMNIEFTLKLAKLCIIDCDLLFSNRIDQLMKSNFDCW